MKTNKLFLFLSLLYLSFNLFLGYSQAPDSLWIVQYGEHAFDEKGNTIIEVSRGFVIAGSIDKNTSDETDFYLMKTDLSGNVIWTKTYGKGGRDEAVMITQTNDGGFAIVGTGAFDPEAYEIWLLRTKPNGDTLWSKHYGGITFDAGYCVQQTSDYGFIITGYSSTAGVGLGDQLYLVKTNKAGDILWEKKYGDEFQNYGRWVIETSDGGYIITGNTYRSNDAQSSDLWLVRTDAMGDSLWTKTYGFINNDFGIRVLEVPEDNGFILIGYTTFFNEIYPDVYVIRTDKNGEVVWEKTYGDPVTEYTWSGHYDYDGNILVSGYTYKEGITDADFFLMKIDIESGDLIWSKKTGWVVNEYAYDMIPTSDLGYMLVGKTDGMGSTADDIVLMKLGEYDYGRLTVGNNGIGAPIEDAQITSDTLIVDIQADNLVGLSVWIDTVLHESTGDLIFTLIHNGVKDTIINRVGADGENFLETKLYDASDLALIKGAAPFSRGYRPHSPLSVFSGMDPTGMWILQIEDMPSNKSKSSTTGVLNAWGLSLVVEGATAIEPAITELEKGFFLYRNYPNPFSIETRISFVISETEEVKLDVYDISGRKVTELLNKRLPAGMHELTWRADNYPEGVYLLKMTVENKSAVQKILISR